MSPRPQQQRSDARASADRALDEIASRYDWIQAISPRNTEAIWTRFARGDLHEPMLEYAPLDLPIDELRRELFAVPIEDIGDPLLEELLREKQLEIERQLTMLGFRDTRGFLQASLDLFGDADAELVDHAELILSTPLDDAAQAARCVGARELARRAAAELDRYRSRWPDFPHSVTIRDDVTAGIMVAGSEVRISSSVSIGEHRVEALLHHEIGTHVLTYYNGAHQPILQFRSGLAHYDALQEGLGVFAELVAGGLNRHRLRTLAARVIAVRSRVDGNSFVDTFQLLAHHHHLPARVAFLTTLRAFRGGGLTKDALYLRGLRDLLAYNADGHDIEPLLVGKMDLRHIPAVRELLDQGVLNRPVAMPRWLASEAGRERFELLRGSTLADLEATL